MPAHRDGSVPPSADDVLRLRVKTELRKRMRALRNTHPASACDARSARVSVRLGALEPLLSASSVALFWPIRHRHEVDLRAFDAALRDRGVRIAYPAVEEEGLTMTFRFVADPEAMEEHVSHGIALREPSPREPEVIAGQLDVVVVPALAVDPRGHRIGYGGGYYDKILPKFAPPAATVAVAFDFQLLAEVPTTATDVAVDYVVTDARSFRVA